jgi:hypothetical protein
MTPLSVLTTVFEIPALHGERLASGEIFSSCT